VRRRAAKVVGATIDENTGSSLYSRIGTTQSSTPCLRMSAGSTESIRRWSHDWRSAACSRRVPKGRSCARAAVGRESAAARATAVKSERRI
jgi:hypothetical protein